MCQSTLPPYVCAAHAHGSQVHPREFGVFIKSERWFSGLEDLSSVLSTHMLLTIPVTPDPGELVPSCGLHGNLNTHGVTPPPPPPDTQTFT